MPLPRQMFPAGDASSESSSNPAAALLPSVLWRANEAISESRGDDEEEEEEATSTTADSASLVPLEDRFGDNIPEPFRTQMLAAAREVTRRNLREVEEWIHRASVDEFNAVRDEWLVEIFRSADAAGFDVALHWRKLRMMRADRRAVVQARERIGRQEEEMGLLCERLVELRRERAEDLAVVGNMTRHFRRVASAADYYNEEEEEEE